MFPEVVRFEIAEEFISYVPSAWDYVEDAFGMKRPAARAIRSVEAFDRKLTEVHEDEIVREAVRLEARRLYRLECERRAAVEREVKRCKGAPREVPDPGDVFCVAVSNAGKRCRRHRGLNSNKCGWHQERKR